MKSIAIITLFSLIVIVACNNANRVTFTTPQPIGAKDLKEIPKRLQGEFVSEDKSHTLIITSNAITKIFDGDILLTTNELDSEIMIIGDTLTVKSDGSKFKIKKQGDSIIYHQHFEDTLFSLNGINILRKLKGFYFVNIMGESSEMWEVSQIGISKGILTISVIDSIENINSLIEVKENNQDTIVNRNISVNRRQFKHIVKENGFGSETKYFKIRSSAIK
jgi:hypothetical protein